MDGFVTDPLDPDTDNDGDAISDDVDKCPMEPEDPDGFVRRSRQSMARHSEAMVGFQRGGGAYHGDHSDTRPAASAPVCWTRMSANQSV